MIRCEYCGKPILPTDFESTARLAYRMYQGEKVQCAKCAKDSRKKREEIREWHLIQSVTA